MKKLLLIGFLLIGCTAKKDNVPSIDKSDMEQAFANAIGSGRTLAQSSGNEDLKVGEVASSNASTRRILYGYLFDIDSREPIANARVTFSSGGPANIWGDLFAMTDDNGRYQIEVTNTGVPYFSVIYKEGYASPGDVTDVRGITYLGTDTSRTSGRIEPTVMRKKNLLCATGEADFGPCPQYEEVLNKNYNNSCVLGDRFGAHTAINGGGSCAIFVCKRSCL